MDAPRERGKTDGPDVRQYAETWLEDRTLKPADPLALPRHCSTSTSSRRSGPIPLRAITPDDVRDLARRHGTRHADARAHAYGLLRTILAARSRTALSTANPCHIRGAGNAKRVHKIKPATLAELEMIGRDARAATSSWCCWPPGAPCGSAS